MVYDSLISASDVYKNLDNKDWVIIDCHFDLAEPEAGWEEHQKEHIPGALYAHLNRDLSGKIIPGKTGRHPLPKIKDFSETVSDWGIDGKVQVVAYDNGGGKIAARLWWLLKWLGHESVAVLDGGLKAWKAEGFPLERKVNSNLRRNFQPALRPDMTKDLSQDANNLPSDFLIIDSRAPERFKGEEEPIDPVAGRIPGSINIFFQDNLTSNDKFRPAEELVERFSKRINRTSENVVFYCGSGVTAAHNILALYASGKGLAKLYPGSWSEWITEPNRPIERG